LRHLFLDRCQWEWIFGFENRDKVFDIHRSFKFNPVILEKGGTTQAIRTAFMRRNLADWERGEDFATPYPRERVFQFSPKSLAILEIQSPRDLEVLTGIYANSVLLGEQGANGWGVKYHIEFMMNTDAKLFPPSTKWEEWGYRSDEYSRWVQGPWKPIEQLYAELGVKPMSEGECRCAQPPYDRLPIPRADIPEGIIFDREATHYLREDDIPIVTFTEANGRALKKRDGSAIAGRAIALPFIEGRMISHFDFSQKGLISGKGRGAVWADIGWQHKIFRPQYLMGERVYQTDKLETYLAFLESQDKISAAQERDRLLEEGELAKWWLHRSEGISIMDVCASTNARTMYSSFTHLSPNGHSAPKLNGGIAARTCPAILNSLIWDSIVRLRLSGLHLVWAVLEEMPMPLISNGLSAVQRASGSLGFAAQWFAPVQIASGNESEGKSLSRSWARTDHERMRMRVVVDALVAGCWDIKERELQWILRDCDHPCDALNRNVLFNAKGFWRVDKDKPPEHRHTVLTLVAFHDLQEKIAACGGDVEKGIEAFCTQNDGEGWMLPETLRLADYGLGHDDRAKEHQPVRECFGPRFYDWQLAQSPEESWRECHLHARNLLGKEGYEALLAELDGSTKSPEAPRPTSKSETPDFRDARGQLYLGGGAFHEDLPLFQQREET